MRPRPASACSFLSATLLVCGMASSAEPIGTPVAMSTTVRSGERFMGMRLLGALRLSNVQKDGYGAVELSALGWDQDESILYAISDAGHIVHLQPRFEHDRLTGTELVASYPLRGKDGRVLRSYLRDAEGLTLRQSENGRDGDTELLISFEGTPRIDAYTPDGRWLRTLPLPPALRDDARYACRNCQLESVTETAALGIVTAPQRPLRGSDRDHHQLYDSHGRVWTFPAMAGEATSVVDLAAQPDGRLLALERRYENIFTPVIFAVRRLTANAVEHPDGGPLAVEDLVILDNTKGWSVDNFEGLAYHRANRWFMVSDDNNSALQSTLLVYFELDP